MHLLPFLALLSLASAAPFRIAKRHFSLADIARFESELEPHQLVIEQDKGVAELETHGFVQDDVSGVELKEEIILERRHEKKEDKDDVKKNDKDDVKKNDKDDAKKDDKDKPDSSKPKKVKISNSFEATLLNNKNLDQSIAQTNSIEASINLKGIKAGQDVVEDFSFQINLKRDSGGLEGSKDD